jgi:outer membrane protein OmpA-like peptidoglycan-associated protein
MNKAVFTLLFRPLLLGSLLMTTLLGNPSVALAADEIRSQQSQEIESLQRRAEKLVSDGLDQNNYHLAKARTWLDMAMSEYYDNDSSGVTAAAIAQAEALLGALEKKQADISMDTPLQFPGSEAVRPDLLDKIAALKKNEKFFCAQRPIAEAEVYLVWTGHEEYESGWSHAESYARNVEDLLYAAQTAIDNCVIAPPAPPPPPPVVIPRVLKKITLSGDALFDSGKSILHVSSLPQLDKLAEDIKGVSSMEEVVLTGHTDRMGSKKYPERNQLLSEQRAESIKQYLASKGIPAEKIRTVGAGATQPIVQCSTKLSKAKQIACLQPNRRVEIVLHGIKEEAVSSEATNNKESPK